MDRYKLITQNLNWLDAMKYCKARRTSLVIITCRSEQQALNRYLKQIPGT